LSKSTKVTALRIRQSNKVAVAQCYKSNIQSCLFT